MNSNIKKDMSKRLKKACSDKAKKYRNSEKVSNTYSIKTTWGKMSS